MSTPAQQAPGISATAGVTLNDWVTADLTVTPQASGDIVCDLDVNGREVVVTFQADGDIDTEVKEG